MLQFCKRQGIQLQAYSPLGYGEFKGKDERTVLTGTRMFPCLKYAPPIP